MIAEDNKIVFVSVFRYIAPAEIEHIAFKPGSHIDSASELFAQLGQLQIELLKLFAPDAIVHIPLGMFADGNGIKPQLNGAKYILPRAVLAVAVIGMGMQIVFYPYLGHSCQFPGSTSILT